MIIHTHAPTGQKGVQESSEESSTVVIPLHSLIACAACVIKKESHILAQSAPTVRTSYIYPNAACVWKVEPK